MEKIPQFKSLEEEREYWGSQSALAKGQRGRVYRPKPGEKHSSFLSVRLTGKEITDIRDLAAKLGIGPSTLARRILLSVIEHATGRGKKMTLEEVGEELVRILPSDVLGQIEDLAKATAVGDVENPAFLIIDAANMKRFETLLTQLFRNVLYLPTARVVNPGSKEYEQVKELIDTAPSR